MKKYLIIGCFISILTTTIAQSNYIEVTVEDTVTLKPIKIQYLIITNPSNTTNTLSLYSDEKKEERKRAPENYLAQTEKVLISNKFTYTKTTFDKFQSNYTYQQTRNYKIDNDDYTYNIENKTTEEGLIVELSGMTDLEKLYSILNTQKGIKGEIFDVVLESKDKYRENIIKSLYTKAQKEASLLAGLGGLKLGRLLSAEEFSNNNYTIWDWYKDIFSSGKFSDIIDISLLQTYSCKFTFKFEVN